MSSSNFWQNRKLERSCIMRRWFKWASLLLCHHIWWARHEMFHIFIAGFSRVKVRLIGLKSPGAFCIQHSLFTTIAFLSKFEPPIFRYMFSFSSLNNRIITSSNHLAQRSHHDSLLQYTTTHSSPQSHTASNLSPLYSSQQQLMRIFRYSF